MFLSSNFNTHSWSEGLRPTNLEVVKMKEIKVVVLLLRLQGQADPILVITFKGRQRGEGVSLRVGRLYFPPSGEEGWSGGDGGGWSHPAFIFNSCIFLSFFFSLALLLSFLAILSSNLRPISEIDMVKKTWNPIIYPLRPALQISVLAPLQPV